MPTVQVWYTGRPAGCPEDYAYLPAGDAPLTRAVKAKDKTVWVVMKKSKHYPARAVGMWAPAADIAAERDRLAAIRTADHVAKLDRARERKQERESAEFGRAVRERFPGCPAGEARLIARYATAVGSGRVGRSSTAEDPVWLAVVAHIRHEHTEYDALLGCYDRDHAREVVSDRIDEVLRLWQAEPAGVTAPAN